MGTGQKGVLRGWSRVKGGCQCACLSPASNPAASPAFRCSPFLPLSLRNLTLYPLCVRAARTRCQQPGGLAGGGLVPATGATAGVEVSQVVTDTEQSESCCQPESVHALVNPECHVCVSVCLCLCVQLNFHCRCLALHWSPQLGCHCYV